MRLIRYTKLLPLVILLIAGSYYYILSAKTFTWIFASGDSGDWLASSNWWIVPQPFGSPLYISLGHFLDLFPGDLVTKMTIILSVVPASVTVALVYLIVHKLTGKEWASVTSSAVLLGASVFLSQATVLEEYAIAVMFVILAFWFYLQDKKWVVALCLGLGTAVHIIVGAIAVLWLVLHFKEVKLWLRVTPIYIASGILPYGLILWLMASDAPRLLAGGLSLSSLNAYLGSTSVVGSLAIFEAPKRIALVIAMLIMSLGLAWIPIVKATRKPFGKPVLMILVTSGFVIWYFTTSLDPTTWTFMTYAMPMLAILAGIGLAKMERQHVNLVMAGALVLIAINGVLLNADRLTRAEPKAITIYNEIWQIPDGSAVVIHRGGFESMALWYAMSEGKDLIPVFFKYREGEDSPLWRDYLEWMAKEYRLNSSSTQQLVKATLDSNIPTYVLMPLLKEWQPAIQWKKTDFKNFGEVKGVDPNVSVYSNAYLQKNSK